MERDSLLSHWKLDDVQVCVNILDVDVRSLQTSVVTVTEQFKEILDGMKPF